MKSSTRSFIILLGVFVVALGITLLFLLLSGAESISYPDFWRKVYSGEFNEVNQSGADVWTASSGDKRYEVVLHDAGGTDTDRLMNYNKGITLAKDEAKTEDDWNDYVEFSFNEYNITITATRESFSSFAVFEFKQVDRYAGSPWDYIYPVLMVTALVVFGIFIYRSMKSTSNVSSNFGKSKANISAALKVRFSDVAGAEEEKEELAEIVEFLKTPAKFSAVGARIPRGVLLIGPPGTGKTLFAKAVAGEANVPFFSISGSDFVEMFVGVGASRVRDLFDQAKKNQPCIIFIDEIDAVGRHRGAGLGGGNDEREQTLNQLLVQMDGFETTENVIVIAATNRSDILDPALMRPGRFDRQVYVNVPDVRGREAIFRVHARNKPMSPNIDFKILARMTYGFTGADIANLLNESAILCARAGRTQIIMEDVYEGIDKVILGAQKKSRLVTEVDKRITAYHEAGHAIVAKRLAPLCDPVHEISIIPRGRAAGYTLMRPETDDDHYMQKKLVADIALGMGGRCAEKIIIEDISAGASGDIKQATEMARRMVTEWGMSELIGPVCHGSGQEVFLGRDYGTAHSYSESTAAQIDAEVKRIICEAYDVAYKIVEENREVLDVLVRVLFEKETIYTEEFEKIVNGATYEEVIEFIDSRTDRKASKYYSVAAAPNTAHLTASCPLTFRSESANGEEHA